MPEPWAMSPEPRTENDDDIEQDEFCIGDDPSVVLDQYLGREELKKLILEEGNIFDNDLPSRTSRIGVLNYFQ